MKPLIEHLDELRQRLIIIIVAFIVSFIVGIALSPFILKRLIGDFVSENLKIVSLAPAEFFFVQIKVAAVIGIFLVSPFLFYHAVKFCWPAAKKREMIAIKYFLPSFVLFFVLGVYFAYAVVLRISVYFLAKLSSLANIANMWSINEFVSFVLITCLAMGVIFQMPLILVLLKKLGVINEKMFSAKRAYVYVALFIIAAFITPHDDPVSQIIISVPLILLYELGIWMMKCV